MSEIFYQRHEDNYVVADKMLEADIQEVIIATISDVFVSYTLLGSSITTSILRNSTKKARSHIKTG